MKDEIVDWSPEIPGHSGDENLKQIFHAGVYLTISAPRFDDDETWVHFGVRNDGRKAVGLGAAGIFLVVAPDARPFRCKAVRTGGFLSGEERATLMIDTRRSENDISASFDPMPRPGRVYVLVEMKRLFASHLLFRIPFEMGVSSKEWAPGDEPGDHHQ